MRHFASAMNKPFRLETVIVSSQFGGPKFNSRFKVLPLKEFGILQCAFEHRRHFARDVPAATFTDFGF